MQLKLPEKQQRPLSAGLGELHVQQSSGLHVQQSSELLNGQPTLLPGLLLEQLQPVRMLQQISHCEI